MLINIWLVARCVALTIALSLAVARDRRKRKWLLEQARPQRRESTRLGERDVLCLVVVGWNPTSWRHSQLCCSLYVSDRNLYAYHPLRCATRRATQFFFVASRTLTNNEARCDAQWAARLGHRPGPTNLANDFLQKFNEGAVFHSG